MNKALILLSGGLDSFIALDIISKTSNVVLALNFDYGQKAFKEENKASIKIAQKYNIKLETIKLPYLEILCDNSLVSSSKKSLDIFEEVWIPNRNGLFINIAASFCDKMKIDLIVSGLNKEEAEQFSDNSIEFIEAVNKSLYYSTQNHAKVVAPCSKMTKSDIINYAINNSLDISLIKSCYDSKNISGKKHCGKCLSCKLLYEAILKSEKPDLIKEVFNADIVY